MCVLLVLVSGQESQEPETKPISSEITLDLEIQIEVEEPDNNGVNNTREDDKPLRKTVREGMATVKKITKQTMEQKEYEPMKKSCQYLYSISFQYTMHLVSGSNFLFCSKFC